MGTRVGTRVGIPGVVPSGTALSPPADQRPQGAGPGLPGWVGSRVGAPGSTGDGGGDGPCTHPGIARARSVPCRALPGAGPSQIAASQPIGARFDLILLKVSQNGQVSPEYVEKACHSPYI